MLLCLDLLAVVSADDGQILAARVLSAQAKTVKITADKRSSAVMRRTLYTTPKVVTIRTPAEMMQQSLCANIFIYTRRQTSFLLFILIYL